MGARTRGHATSKRLKTKQAHRMAFASSIRQERVATRRRETDVVMRDLSRQDRDCERLMLALSDSESD